MSEPLLRRIGRAALSLPLDLVRAILLLSAFASFGLSLLAVGGRLVRVLDLIAHFALAGFLISLLTLAASVAIWSRGGRKPAALALAGLVVWGVLIAPDYVRALTAPRALEGGETVKIVQFNLWIANANPIATADWILKENPDVVVVEEVGSISGRVVERLKARYPHLISCYDPYPCSTMILTRQAPVRSGGWAIPFGQANLAWVTLNGPGGDYTVMGVHHAWPSPLGMQAVQVPWTANVLKGFDKTSLILAGDFNSTPWSRGLRDQDKAFGLQRRTLALPTWPARTFERRPFAFPVPLLPIDQVYAGSAWKTVSVRRGPRLGSDHYPVVVTLRRDAAPVAKSQPRP